MQNAHQQHFSLFNWETHATAHKSSSTRTSAVVCEPGETAHKSSSTHTSAVVCEPCETTHKTSPNLPFAMVVWEPRASAHNTCWPGYLSSVRRDSACSGRLLLVTAFENIVPANMEQTKKGHVSYPVILTESLPPPPTLLLRYPHTPCVHPHPPHPRQCAVREQAGG